MSDKDKLHALLAVVEDRKKTKDKITAETTKTLTNRQDHFSGSRKVYTPFDENDKDLEPSATKPVVTTVGDKIGYFEDSIKGFIDALYQKARTNCNAKADLVIEVEGKEPVIIEENVPAQFLVELENQLVQWRSQVYNNIPTLDPNKDWHEVSGKEGHYQTDTLTTTRTRKKHEPLVLHEGNENHPPQTQVVMVDVPVGKYETVQFSTCITSVEKSKKLKKLDMLIEAVKKARSKANEEEIVKGNLAYKLFGFLND